MADARSTRIRAQLCVVFNAGVTAGLTDGQLLERFTTQSGDRAEAAFAALVERHAPMVFRTCFGILGEDQDAMDAFQATFLVLVRKGSSLWVHDSLGPWLHRVACRVSIRAKVAARKRQQVERDAARHAPDRSTHEGRETLLRALLEEVDGLPDRYRLPVVMCDLQGHTYEDAARAVGCPVGTLKSRLARARERLRERLIRRRLAQPCTLTTASLYANLTELAMPATLPRAVVEAAIVTGEAALGGVPLSVMTLTREVLRIMRFRQLMKLAGVLLVACTLTAATALFVPCSVGAVPLAVEQEAPEGNKSAQRTGSPAPKVVRGPGEIVARVVNLADGASNYGLVHTVAIDPVTAEWRTVAKNLPPGRVSPDGRYIVFSQVRRNHDADEPGIWVYDTTGEAPPRRIFEVNGEPHWSNHGKAVIIGVPIGPRYEEFENWRVNADGTERTRLPIPRSDLVLDCSTDGEWLAARAIGGEPAQRGRMTLSHQDGTAQRILTEGSAQEDVFTIFKIAPDSRRVAYTEVRTKKDVRSCRLFIVDIDGRNRRELPVQFEPDTTVGVHWSPDGTRLALNLLDGRTKEGAVAVIDVDGRNYRTLPLPAGRWNLHVCDWNVLDPQFRVGDLARIMAPDPQTPRGRYRALCEEAKNANPAERRRLLGRFLELAESVPDQRAAVDAWVWIVTFGSQGPEFEKAIDRLVDRAKTIEVGQAAMSLGGSMSLAAEKLLRAVVDRNESRNFRGYACLTLGRYLEHHSQKLREIASDPEVMKQYEEWFLEEGADVAAFARFIARDPDALSKEAERVLERVRDEFADVRRTRDRTLADEARAELDEIRNLCVGKPAPDIEGEDVDGKPLHLSDFRGKVTVVSFWGHWCGSCRALYGQEKALAAKMTGRPFVLLGVNSDGDRDEVKKVSQDAGLSWRSWWDGGKGANEPGPIALRYNVHTWPTFYVLDHLGVIRGKFVGTPSKHKLSALVEELVNAAEVASAEPAPKGASQRDLKKKDDQ